MPDRDVYLTDHHFVKTDKYPLRTLLHAILMSTAEIGRVIDGLRQRFIALSNQLGMSPQLRESVQAIGLETQMVMSNLLARIEMLEEQARKQK
jgi:hypothetical protein